MSAGEIIYYYYRCPPPWQRPQDVRLLGVIDIQPVLAQHADLESDLLNLLWQLRMKETQGIQQI